MAFPKVEGFVVTEKLGSGSYSTVYKAYPKVGPRSVIAIKCVEKSRLKNSESGIDNLITEIRLLKTLKHPHIVQMVDFSWDDKHIFIQTEYCNGGDLSKYIKRCGRIQERRVKIFLQQLASALKFLREQGVAHMDLKPHNLLLNKSSDGKYILKVTDFGFAQYMSAETRCNSIRGSPLYMAPEMLTAMDSGVISYDAKVDLWSVGVIIYECLFGKAPYCSNTLKELLEKIKSRAPIEIPPNASVSASCIDLLTRLLQHDPSLRISYEDFFRHGYLDLDHMPSKENYEMAVNLIKKAIDLDSKRQFEPAFENYCQSLRYLVPFVNSEIDPVRRSALKAKVLRYMNRAEELKVLLNKDSHASQRVADESGEVRAKPSVVRMCFDRSGTHSMVVDGPSAYMHEKMATQQKPMSNAQSPEFHTSNTENQDGGAYNQYGAAYSQDGGVYNQDGSTGNPMFCFGRDYQEECDGLVFDTTMSKANFLSNKSLEEMGANVPYLETHDSSIMNELPPKNPKKLTRENSEGLCNIQ